MTDRRTVLAGLAALPTIAATRGDPVATTAGGRVKGLRNRGVLVFKGIRYGSAPRRFARAVPAPAWSHVADATRYGAAAQAREANGAFVNQPVAAGLNQADALIAHEGA